MNFDKRYKRNLITGSVIILCILAITTSASWISIKRLLDSQHWVNHTHEVLINLERIISKTKDAETGQRGYLLTGAATFLDPYNGSQEEVWKAFNQVSSLTIDNPAQQHDLSRVEDIVTNRFALLDKSIQMKQSGQSINWRNIERGRLYMAELRGLINRMERREEILMDVRKERLGGFATYTPWVILFAAVIAFVVTIVFYLRLTADYKQKLMLQAELLDKEEQIQKKIDVVQKFSEAVAEGNYKMRINKEDLN